MFTKAEVAKMSTEQQEVLAQIELSKLRQRQQLIEVVRGSDWRSRCVPIFIWTPCVILFVLELCNVFDSKEMTYVIYVSFGLVFFSSLICVLNTRNNQRLNALLELLDFDHKNPDDSNNSKDEKIS
jgi:hypothetical protein